MFRIIRQTGRAGKGRIPWLLCVCDGATRVVWAPFSVLVPVPSPSSQRGSPLPWVSEGLLTPQQLQQAPLGHELHDDVHRVPHSHHGLQCQDMLTPKLLHGLDLRLQRVLVQEAGCGQQPRWGGL